MHHPLAMILDALSSSTPPQAARDVAWLVEQTRDLLKHGEAKVALEILCDNLLEFQTPLPRQVFSDLQALAISMQMSQARIEPLRMLIVE